MIFPRMYRVGHETFSYNNNMSMPRERSKRAHNMAADKRIAMHPKWWSVTGVRLIQLSRARYTRTLNQCA